MDDRLILRREYLLAAGVAGLVLSISGCAKGDVQARDRGGTPQVGYRIMHPADVTLETELPGRIAALRSAEVRPQISGVVQRRLFTEGTFVRAGQPLYQIDASLYRAAADQAQANLASAQASAVAAEAKAARFRPLAEAEAVARQDYADALAQARSARAAVAQTGAALNTARITLRFTTVPAPITGRIGRSLFTVGALVTTGQADPLAVISVLDPVYVDLQQSSTDLLRLRRQMAAGGVAPITTPLRLVLDDGSDYGFSGTLEFSEVTADPQTGTVTLRARFPNPQGLLLPGMFVRARLAQSSQANAFLVPQVALSRDPKGAAQVYVLGPGNAAMARTVTATVTRGDAWVVTAGLRDGDRLITQGLGKLRPGQPVKPVPETAPQRAQAPAGAGKRPSGG